jgi:hypothetical protein
MRLLLPALILFGTAVPASATAAEPVGEVRFLPTFLSGDFGTGVESDIAYLPLSLTVRGDRSRGRLTVPWLSIKTSEPITFVGGDVIRRGMGGVTEASGPGDVVGEWEYDLVQGGAGRPWFSAGCRAKIPTADERDGLGTGELDHGPLVAIIQPAGEAWHLLGEARYVIRGDPPGIDYRNTWWLAFGAQRDLGERGTVSLILDHRQSVLRGRETIRDLTVGWDRRFTPVVALKTALYLGLSDTAEDWGFSAGLAFRAAPRPAPGP